MFLPHEVGVSSGGNARQRMLLNLAHATPLSVLFVEAPCVLMTGLPHRLPAGTA